MNLINTPAPKVITPAPKAITLAPRGFANVVALLAALCLFVGMPAAARAGEGDTGSVRLTLDQYEALMRAARQGRVAASWGRASVRVSLTGDGYGRVALTAPVSVPGDGQAEVVLLPGDVVLEEVSLDGAAGRLSAAHGAWTVRIDAGRTVAVTMRYLVRLQASDTGQALVVPLPPVPGSSVRVEGAQVTDLQPRGPLQRSGGVLTASVPGTAAVVVTLSDVAEALTVRRARYAVVVDDSAKGADIRVELATETHKAGQSVRLAPQSVALVEATVDGKPALTRIEGGWHVARLADVGKHAVVAHLRMLVDRSQGQPSVAVALNRWSITELSASIPGDRQVHVTPEVPLTHEKIEGGRTRATGFLPPSDRVSIRWTESRPEPEKLVRLNAETFQLVSLSEGVMRSKVAVRYEILRGKTKVLSIEIPDDVVLYKAEGAYIEDWRTFAAKDGQPRQIQVTLSREVEGSYQLSLQLEQVVPKTEGARLIIPVVRPLKAFRETGVVALFDGKKVGFGPATQTTFTPVGQDALPTDIRAGLQHTVTQAFKHIGAPGQIRSKVTLVQEKEVLYDAHVFALYSVKEGAILANATVQVEVKSGRNERLVLDLPDEVTILSVIAPSVSKKGAAHDVEVGEGRKAYELKFSQALEGTIEAHLEFEWVPKTKGGPLRLPDLRVIGAEVQDGSFGITAETGIEVGQASAKALRRVDASELPESVRRRAVGSAEILLGYQYAHSPWELTLDVKRHETVQTLTAAVTGAWLETTVFEDGHVVTRAVFRVKNDDRQFLRLRLPEGAKVWTVSYDGAPVKAVSDESGALAIPLRKGREVPIEVVYETTQSAIGGIGELAFEGPKTDVLVTDLQWLVRLPQGLALHSVESSMQTADAADYRPPPFATTALPVAMPDGSGLRMLMFALPVNDAAEPAPTVSMRYVVRPSEDLGQTIWWVALLLLGVLAIRQALGTQMGVLGWLMLAAGLLGVSAKAMAFGVDGCETTWAVVWVAAAAVLGLLIRWARRRTAEVSS